MLLDFGAAEESSEDEEEEVDWEELAILRQRQRVEAEQSAAAAMVQVRKTPRRSDEFRNNYFCVWSFDSCLLMGPSAWVAERRGHGAGQAGGRWPRIGAMRKSRCVTPGTQTQHTTAYRW